MPKPAVLTYFRWILLSLLIASPAWAQTGRILTSSGSAFGGIIEFNSDGTNALNITANTFNSQIVPDGRSKSQHPTASTDGSKIAFESNRDGKWRIYVMNGDGSNVRQLTTDENIGDRPAGQVEDHNPAISPDGTKVLFVSNRYDIRSGDGWFNFRDLFCINVDGTGFQQLTDPQIEGGVASRVYAAAWNPQGTKIAMRAKRLFMVEAIPTFMNAVVILNPDGSVDQYRQAAFDCGDGEVIDWSPDGSRILYSWGGAVQSCFDTYYSLLGMGETPNSNIPSELLGPAPNRAGTVRFSPDGQRLVYLTDYNKLAFIDIDGSNREVIDVPVVRDSSLWWMPGNEIPAPATMTISPNPIVVWECSSAMAVPRVFDAMNALIVQAAAGWAVDPMNAGTLSMDNTGRVYGQSGENRIYTLTATNGGLTATATILNLNKPLVSIEAADAEADEADASPASFRLTRLGNPAGPLTVTVRAGGSAYAGRDYTAIETTVNFAPGAATADVEVAPLHDGLPETVEEVTLTVESGETYFPGDVSSATVTIANEDLDTVFPDISGDNLVNAVDIQTVVNAVLEIADTGHADANSDGSVNAVDIQAVINTVLGLG